MPDSFSLSDLVNPRVDSGASACIIYSELQSERLHYVCDFIFKRVLSVNYELSSNLKEFENSKKIRINYSNGALPKSIQIVPEGLLFEKGMRNNTPEFEVNRPLHYCFSTGQRQTDAALHFDVFSAVFFCISRYEEWQKFEPDSHGRFDITQSIFYKFNCHLLPLADLWIMEFKNKLLQLNPLAVFPQKKAQVISTIDVDNLYAFKFKSFARTFGAFCKDLLKGDLKNFSERIKVLSGKQKDPFDIYDEVSAFCATESIALCYFFLYRSGTKHDRTVQPRSAAFLEVFQRIKKNTAHIGLHPSYSSSEDTTRMQKEFEELSSDLGIKITSSRQHFLRFNIRSTPHQLIKNGVQIDFSLGYANSPGFRAGTSFPFWYYDFDKEKEGQLLLVPFCFMDGAYSIHLRITEDEALNNLLNLASEIKKTGGYFVSVFHERSFSNHLYPGFGTLYRNLHLQLKGLFHTEI